MGDPEVVSCRQPFSGVTGFPLTVRAACPASWLGIRGSGGPCGRTDADLVWAGQAEVAGGPLAAPCKVSHWCSRCQSAGRHRVTWPTTVPGGEPGDGGQVAADGGAAGFGVGEAG